MNKVSYPRNKVLGGIWGLIIGDAVGVPYEFTPQEDIPSIDKIDKSLLPPDSVIPFSKYAGNARSAFCQ